MQRRSPPASLSALMLRARALDGMTVGEVARRLRFPLRESPARGKGKIGELLERALGASAGCLDLPDFPHLGVELKSIPVDALGRVRQSTFVCSLDLRDVDRERWMISRVRRKLSCVLWIPVEAGSRIPPERRHLGTPMIWRPSPEQEDILRGDWMELVGRIACGGIEEITGHMGRALQIRPKARNAAERVEGYGPEGEALPVNPRGFYLRARFTERILWSDPPPGD